MKLSFKWMSDPQYLAQVGHFFGAYSVAFTGGIFFPHALVWIVLGALALASVKEFVFDVASWGEGDSWRDSAEDFAFYAGGAILAVLITILRTR